MSRLAFPILTVTSGLCLKMLSHFIDVFYAPAHASGLRYGMNELFFLTDFKVHS